MLRERGFTLMELMVALVIAGILLVVTVPGFIRFRSSLVRDQVKWALVADLRYARQLAVTKHRPVVIAFGNGSTTTDITTYTLHTDSDGDGVKDSGELVLNRTLPRGGVLTLVSLAPVDTVIFDASGSLRPGATGGQIIYRGAQGNVDTLNVSAIGMVYHS